MDIYYVYRASRRSYRKENEGLFPKSAKEDNKNFIQNLTLENNCSIETVFSLYQLCKVVCDNLTGIIPIESITR